MENQIRRADDRLPITEFVWTWFLRRIATLPLRDVPGWVWVVLIWAFMAFPAVSIRGTHYEEGTVIGLARGALEDGHWLTPYLYGLRFVERPVLLSWIVAALGSLSGGVSVWTARVPHLLFMLGGGLMIFALVRARSRNAPGVMGALCWFACPMIAQKFVTAEPDVAMSVTMFGAFVLWWTGEGRGHVSWPRWLAIGLVLAAAGLIKGPQPLAYFTLGVGAYLVVKQRWNDCPGFVAANVMSAFAALLWYWTVASPGDVAGWKIHSRLFEGMSFRELFWDHLNFLYSIVVEWLPGSILLIPAAVALARRRLGADADLVLAVVLYALVCTCVLLIWPGGIATRYAMPANPALAVLCGLLFDRWWASRAWLIAAVNTISISIAVYIVVLGWVAMPLAPDTFRRTRIGAQTIDAARVLLPGPLYVGDMADVNILAYITAPIRRITIDDIERLKAPALAMLTHADIAALVALKPNLRIAPQALLGDKMTAIYEIKPD